VRKGEERAQQATTLSHDGVCSTSSAVEGEIVVQIAVAGGDADHVASVGRELQDHDPDWHLVHVATAADGPARDSDRPPDVLVCASRVGASSGLAVLAGLRPRHPGAVRILLLEPDAEHDLLDAFSTSHRILSEPLDSLALIDAIESVVELRELLDDPSRKHAIGRVGTRPAAPRQHLAVTARLPEPDRTAAKLAEAVAQDA